MREQLKKLSLNGYSPELIATDIDGTLINSSSRIPSRTLKVLRRIYRGGTPLILTTGRPTRWIHPITEQLGFRPLCVCTNGAVIYDSDSDEVLGVTELQTEALAHIAITAQSLLPGVAFAVERVGGVGSSSSDDVFFMTKNYNRVWHDPLDRIVSEDEVISAPCTKLLIRHHEFSSAAIAEVMSEALHDIATVTYSLDGGLAEVSALAVSKVHGLESCVSDLGLSRDNVIAFGDMPNDIELLQWAGLGVAMGNAHERVRQAANLVTTSNDDNGIARVLEEWWPADSLDHKDL